MWVLMQFSISKLISKIQALTTRPILQPKGTHGRYINILPSETRDLEVASYSLNPPLSVPIVIGDHPGLLLVSSTADRICNRTSSSVMFTGHVSLENEQWCLLKSPDYAANSLSLKIEAWRSTDST
ncbi:hypothetical protein NL676_034794 [Syzygium grande]|nr:hypothetical protein NL676_034794 [Syzygium grande]